LLPARSFVFSETTDAEGFGFVTFSELVFSVDLELVKIQTSADTATTTGLLHVLKDRLTASPFEDIDGFGMSEKPHKPAPTQLEEAFLKNAPISLNFLSISNVID
jgi:hypothetical protein